MARISAIVGSPDESRVRSLIDQGLSLRQLESKTNYTLAQIRSYKKFLAEESLYVPPTEGEYKDSLLAQLKRLHSLLQLAQRGKKDIETILKVEQRIAEITKTLIALDKEQSIDERADEIDAHRAEIASLISIIQTATDDCKECRTSVRAALQPFLNTDIHDTEHTNGGKAG